MTPTNERPTVEVTMYVLARRVDGRADAVKHTYDVHLDRSVELLKSTLCHILAQRFPNAKSFDFVTEKEYRKAIEDGTAEEGPSVRGRDTLLGRF